MQPKPLTRQQEQAALAVAQDDATDAAIATKVGISKRQLERWKHQPNFAARVTEHRTAWRKEVTEQGLADSVQRIRELRDRCEKLQRVIAERAADPHYQQVAGGSTGLLTRKSRIVGSGEQARVVWEHPVDTALLRELRAHERQIAQELGQWVDKKTVSIPDLNAQLEKVFDELIQAGREEGAC